MSIIKPVCKLDPQPEEISFYRCDGVIVGEAEPDEDWGTIVRPLWDQIIPYPEKITFQAFGWGRFFADKVDNEWWWFERPSPYDTEEEEE